jgi:hypothetical protein
MFSGNSLLELDQGCQAAPVSLPSSFDNMNLSVNFGATIPLSNAGWWHSKTEACSVLMSKVREQIHP